MSSSNRQAWYLAQLIGGLKPKGVNPTQFKGQWAEAYSIYLSANGRGPASLRAWLAQPGREGLRQAVFAHAPNSPMPPEESNDYNLTDLGNAERLADQHHNHLRHVPEWDWMTYAEGRWERNPAFAVRAAKVTIRKIYAEASNLEDSDRRKQVAGWALKSEASTRIDAMLKLARSEARLYARPEEFDRDPGLLNCKNGLLDLRTGKLREHDADDLITRQGGTNFDLKARCPVWLSFLHKIFDADGELIDFVQRAIGYSLTGDTSEQVMFFCYGGGRNGKSTLLETLRAVLGDYGQQAEASTFLVRNSDTIRNDLARLVGVRMVTSIEVGEGRRLNETLVKQVTGQDSMTARFLHREYFEFAPQFKLWMAANHKPVIRGTDEAIWRRILLIPFNVTIAKQDVDRRLRVKLQTELPGILAWAMAGCLQWQKHGLRPPRIVQEATNEYRGEMDVIAAFINECCVVTDEARVTAGDLYRAYKQWAEASREHIDSQRSFGARITERNFERAKSNGALVYRGIGLLDTNSRKGDEGDEGD